MKKWLIALLFVSSFAVFADRDDRDHDRDRDRNDRHGINFGMCSAALKQNGRVIRIFSVFGFNSCNRAMNKCYKADLNNDRFEHGRRDRSYCELLNR